MKLTTDPAVESPSTILWPSPSEAVNIKKNVQNTLFIISEIKNIPFLEKSDESFSDL